MKQLSYTAQFKGINSMNMRILRIIHSKKMVGKGREGEGDS
jgi:hypothetical protein